MKWFCVMYDTKKRKKKGFLKLYMLENLHKLEDNIKIPVSLLLLPIGKY